MDLYVHVVGIKQAHLNAFDFWLTFIRPASDECQAKIKQKLDEVFSCEMTQLFLEQRKSCMEVRQTFDLIQTWFDFYSTSIHTFFERFQHGHRAVQMDPTLFCSDNKFIERKGGQKTKPFKLAFSNVYMYLCL